MAATLLACTGSTIEPSPVDAFETMLVRDLTTPELQAEYCRRYVEATVTRPRECAELYYPEHVGPTLEEQLAHRLGDCEAAMPPSAPGVPGDCPMTVAESLRPWRIEVELVSCPPGSYGEAEMQEVSDAWDLYYDTGCIFP